MLRALAVTLACAFSAAAATRPAVERISRLETAEVGEWARYATRSGESHYRVVHRTLLLADVEIRTLLEGKPVGLPAVRTLRQTADFALDLSQQDEAEVRAREETVDAAGRRWPCRRTDSRWSVDGRACERRVWMCGDAPVLGVVRVELLVDGKLTARMELTGFGFAASTERPAAGRDEPQTRPAP